MGESLSWESNPSEDLSEPPPLRDPEEFGAVAGRKYHCPGRGSSHIAAAGLPLQRSLIAPPGCPRDHRGASGHAHGVYPIPPRKFLTNVYSVVKVPVSQSLRPLLFCLSCSLLQAAFLCVRVLCQFIFQKTGHLMSYFPADYQWFCDSPVPEVLGKYTFCPTFHVCPSIIICFFWHSIFSILQASHIHKPPKHH